MTDNRFLYYVCCQLVGAVSGFTNGLRNRLTQTNVLIKKWLHSCCHSYLTDALLQGCFFCCKFLFLNSKRSYTVVFLERGKRKYPFNIERSLCTVVPSTLFLDYFHSTYIDYIFHLFLNCSMHCCSVREGVEGLQLVPLSTTFQRLGPL